ncbi:NHLP bacteriocin export ABC transporter permease/ATPase subunit [Streptomyces sp. NPDC050560]|uniref:NHLP bacteriocin export ABC transporter permease/ATPase subunit n=1 Tax=Streptomyces sp. NPDC050560 TaxID=3365630 RepID=UPI003792E4C1
MDRVDPQQAATAQVPAAASHDPVVAELSGLGAAVDAAAAGVHLAGPEVLWLVAGGALDLFAVDTADEGPWHFLGRVEAGALLLGPVRGPRHTLLARPAGGCALRRIPLRELSAPLPEGAAPDLAALEQACALGVSRGLGVLFHAPFGSRTPAVDAAVSDADLPWLAVWPGAVVPGGHVSPQAAGDLLVDPRLWERIVDQQYRLLSAVDHWIERLEQAHADRTAAGIRAGEHVEARADQALVASIGDRRPTAARPRDDRDDDALFAVCRLVASATGIALDGPPRSAAPAGRVGPVERIAAHAGVRCRAVRLEGAWWRADAGPLVGARARSGSPVALLPRRGGYVALNPLTGTRTRITDRTAGDFEPRAVMFYRPLPERPLSPLRLLRFSLRGARPDVRLLTLASLVSIALGGLVPIATGKVLGVFVPRGETGLITGVAVALMVSGVVAAAFGLLQNLAVLRIEGRAEGTLQPAVWDRLLRLPTEFFTRRSTGELASAALGVSVVRRTLSGVGPVVLQSTTVGAVNFALLLWFSRPLALAAIGVLVVVGALFLLLGLWEVRWQRRIVVLGNKLNNRAYQTLRGLPKLRVAAAESFAYAAWAREFAASRRLQQRAGFVKNLNAVFGAVYLPACSLLMFMLLAGPARGSMSADAFLTFNTSMTMLLTSVTQLTGALVSVAAVLPMFEQIRPVFKERPEVRGSSVKPGVLGGALAARKVSFRYGDDGPLVLDEVDVEVAAGEFVAVVGPSGCGKSTLLRLLIGFEQPLSGAVLYDGQDLAALDRAAVRRQCGVVLQHAQPLTGSILDCVRGAESFTQEEVWEALELAGLAEDVRQMPMGLHTVVSGGDALSGGQRQRLMIAGTLVRRPRLLFFDEATSALDNDAQRVVMDSTRNLSATRIVIAHRLSTVMDADRVLVMDGGRIVESGRPAELAADPSSRFHDLVRRQQA